MASPVGRLEVSGDLQDRHPGRTHRHLETVETDGVDSWQRRPTEQSRALSKSWRGILADCRVGNQVCLNFVFFGRMLQGVTSINCLNRLRRADRRRSMELAKPFLQPFLARNNAVSTKTVMVPTSVARTRRYCQLSRYQIVDLDQNPAVRTPYGGETASALVRRRQASSKSRTGRTTLKPGWMLEESTCARENGRYRCPA